MGFPLNGRQVGEWVVDAQWWSARRQQAAELVKDWASAHDIAAGMPLETLRQQVDLPAADLVATLLEGTGLEVADGLVRQPGIALPPRVDKAVRAVEEWLAEDPFRAPEADELADLKLGPRELAAAVRAGRLTRVADGVVLGPDVADRAADVLQKLPQPFTVSTAKRALGTTRRVAVPLLELLDSKRVTRRNADGTRTT
jgi:selenocysteine-specific elongation factor